MPVGEEKAKPHKKCSQKKRRIKQKSKSKRQVPEKNLPNSKQTNLNILTPANLSSLRWDYVLTDPTQENDRIEQYKELRRQRYTDARQQAVQNLVEKMKITISEK